MVNAKRQRSPGTPEAPAAHPKNAGAKVRKEYECALEIWESQNDIAYYATSVPQNTMHQQTRWQILTTRSAWMGIRPGSLGFTI